MAIILILVIIDLLIKTIVYFNFMDTHIKFFGGWMGIVPTINREQSSMLYSETSIGIETTTVLINILILTALFFIYYRFVKTGYMNLHIKVIIAMFISGSICLLIDKVVLGGSLDYVFIKNWVFDLNDMYLYASLFYMIIYLLKSGNFPKKGNIRMHKKLPWNQ
ncbi:MAG TPA: signal peptidase II [Pseudobacteroides sp.]|uniref:signal peptidase II n=1 Tax=Pseudobacteroides sp. TaxID=1968840 RepID=UPI002F942170